MSATHDGQSTSTFGELMYFKPGGEGWRRLNPHPSPAPDGSPVEPRDAPPARDELRQLLLSSLQMQHVAVLAGSGTSLGKPVGGPSMADLWAACVEPQDQTKRALAGTAIAAIRYDTGAEGKSIEALLSRCESFLPLAEGPEVESFITHARATILDRCSAFLERDNEEQLAGHRTFLHRLSRRRTRDSRLKIFTTNYDLCFEHAAGRQGLVVIDGFSFAQPRTFDARFFSYDIVRRPQTSDDAGVPLEGVIHLHKLHGSVNWARAASGSIEVSEQPKPEHACLIYPARGKYQQSYVQPHLELFSRYFAAIREPNTCLIVTGFGFNDDHLSEPILAAAQTNPHLRLIIVDPAAEQLATAAEPRNRYWSALHRLASQGDDIWLINATFQQFANLIPDLRALTPAQQLAQDVRKVAGQ